MFSSAFGQVAVKEANIARQEEDRAEQRRKAKSDKKAQKKMGRDVQAAEKRKAPPDYEDNWNNGTGK